jgi:hypothetical protein
MLMSKLKLKHTQVHIELLETYAGAQCCRESVSVDSPQQPVDRPAGKTHLHAAAHCAEHSPVVCGSTGLAKGPVLHIWLDH